MLKYLSKKRQTNNFYVQIRPSTEFGPLILLFELLCDTHQPTEKYKCSRVRRSDFVPTQYRNRRSITAPLHASLVTYFASHPFHTAVFIVNQVSSDTDSITWLQRDFLTVS